MARGKNIRSARDAARHFQHMLRIQGRVVLDVDGSLWVLGCSEDETSRGLGAGCDPFALCSLLREPAAPRAARLAALLAATDRVEVTAGRLGKWSHSLLILEAAMPDIERWIADGHAALRKWRGHDLPALLESWRTALERCSLMHRRCTALAARGLLGGGEFEDGEQLLTILELAASSLILPVAFDPARELCSRAWRVEQTLLEHLFGEDPARARRASALLGARGQAGRITLEHIPESLQGAYRAGRITPRDRIGALIAVGPTRRHAEMLAAIDLDLLPWVPTLLTRIAALFGSEHAAWVLKEGLRLSRKRAMQKERERAMTARFLESLELLLLLERDDVADAWLPPAIEPLKSTASRDNATLAKCFRQFIEDATSNEGEEQRPDLINTRALVHAAQRADVPSLVGRAEAMANAWLERGAEASTVESDNEDHENHPARCAAAFYTFHARVRIDDELSGNMLRSLYRITNLLDTKQLRIRWREFAKLPVNQLNHPHWIYTDPDIDYRPGDIALIREHTSPWVACQAYEKGGAAAFFNYLDAIRALEETGSLATLEIDEPWFVNLFTSGKPWCVDYLLTLSSEASQRVSGEALAMQLITLTKHAAGEQSSLDHHLTRWNNPVLLEQHDDLDAIGERASIERETLVAYLHHRRIARGREDFSKQIHELLDTSEDPGKTRAQIAWIERELAREDGALSDGRRDELHDRLETLRARDVQSTREQNSRRARRQIERSLEALEAESLERTLDLYWSELLSAKLQREILPEQIDKRIREISGLLNADEDVHELFYALLDALLSNKEIALSEWEANKQWLERQVERGLDTERWLGGFSEDTTIAGERFQVTIEQDPIEVLKMGSYFQTCLSLGSRYAGSVLLNAIDCNKHVVYVRDERGALVGRKLIAISANGNLLGYKTYARGGFNDALLQRAIDPLVEAFAIDCGLILVDDGPPPTPLHDKDAWYDDGVRPWSRGFTHQIAIAENVDWWDVDASSRIEHAFAKARHEDDLDLLEELEQVSGDMMRSVVSRAILKRDPERWEATAMKRSSPWDVPAPVNAHLFFGGGIRDDDRARARQCYALMRATYREDHTWEFISYMLWAATGEPLRDALVTDLHSMRKRCIEGGKHRNPGYFELRNLDCFLSGGVGSLATLLDALEDLFCIAKHHAVRYREAIDKNILGRACELLAIHWAVDPDGATLLDYIDEKKSPALRQAICLFLSHIQIPGASDRLLRKGNRPQEGSLPAAVKAWIAAIKKQRDQRARAELERLLDAFPQYEQELFEALAACGDSTHLDARAKKHLRHTRRAVIRALDALIEEGNHKEEPAELLAALREVVEIGTDASVNVLTELCELCETHARSFDGSHSFLLAREAERVREAKRQQTQLALRPRPELTGEEVALIIECTGEHSTLRLLYLCSNLLHAPERETRRAAYANFGKRGLANEVLCWLGGEFHATREQTEIKERARAALRFGSFGYNNAAMLTHYFSWLDHLESPDGIYEIVQGKGFQRDECTAFDISALLELATIDKEGCEKLRAHARETFFCVFLRESDELDAFTALSLAWFFVEPDDEDGRAWLKEMLHEKLDKRYLDTEEIAEVFGKTISDYVDLFSVELAMETLTFLEEHNPSQYNDLLEYLERDRTQRSLGLARASRSQTRTSPST